MTDYVVILKVRFGDDWKKKNLKIRRVKNHSEARLKAIRRYKDSEINIVDIMTLFRHEEIKKINEYLKHNTPITRLPTPEKICFDCRKTLKRKHMKWKFRNLHTGKPRHYCEECVEDIDAITFVKLKLIKVY